MSGNRPSAGQTVSGVPVQRVFPTCRVSKNCDWSVAAHWVHTAVTWPASATVTNVFCGNNADTWSTSSRGTTLSMSPSITSVGTLGYVGWDGVTGEDGLGFCHHRHCFSRLTPKLVPATLENGAKWSGGRSS